MLGIGSWSARTKVILIQAAVLAGLIMWFTLGLPGIRKERAASQVAEREQRIESFVRETVAAVPGRTAEALEARGEVAAHPQRLLSTPSLEEAEQALGAPQTSSTDFRGGEHLTWIGTRHRLEAIFNQGRLYALTLTDLRTGHGSTILESSAQWQSF
jgi:hypothetical protein